MAVRFLPLLFRLIVLPNHYVPLFLVLSPDDIEQVVYCLLLKVSLLYEHLAWSVEHCLCCVKAETLYRADNPWVDLVGTLIKTEVIAVLPVVSVSVDINGVFCQQ